MRVAWIAIVMMACGGTASTPVAPAPKPAPVVAAPADPIEQALVEIEGLRDHMCACTDAACADKVDSDQQAWRHAIRERFRDEKREPTAAQDERGRAADKSYRDCRRKLRGPGTSTAEAIAQLGAFKDQMCACKDKACAQKVIDGMTKWSEQAAKNAADADKVTADEAKKMTEVTDQLTSCVTKLMAP